MPERALERAEETLLIIKPDGVSRRLTGVILARIERKGYMIERMKMINVSSELAQKHYEVHKGQSFYEKLVNYITSGPVVVAIIQGEGCIGGLRYIMGNTDPLEAAPGTIRGDYATNVTMNLIHGSDSPESAEREIELFFPDYDLC